MELLNYLTGFGGSALQYIIGFLSVLMVIVFVHEMGHFLVARWCGIKVDAFSIGFGKELIGFTDKKTRDGSCALFRWGAMLSFLAMLTKPALVTPRLIRIYQKMRKNNIFTRQNYGTDRSSLRRDLWLTLFLQSQYLLFFL